MDRIPESCRDLDPGHVTATFVACRANISEAAKKLHVPSADLRRLVLASPELLAVAFQKEERRLDKAEKILDRELDSDDSRCATAAGLFTLRNSKRAASRGWRQPDVEVAVSNAGPPVRCSIFWGDGTKIGEVDYPAGTKFPQRVIEHEDPARANKPAE